MSIWKIINKKYMESYNLLYLEYLERVEYIEYRVLIKDINYKSKEVKLSIYKIKERIKWHRWL